jgi:photosystem II stability/assembly factor-like uncharacterized protein
MKQMRLVLSLLLVLPSPALAQDAATIQRAVTGLEWREIGPATMGGRISDLAVLESNPAVFYVGTATGGIWRTTNHGTTWTPLFDEQETSSIGDVTLAPSNPNVVWVGTGEHQNRQSSPWGAGVYRSTDAGRTWTHLGLTNTRHISRIVVHSRDPDVAWVGAVGHLWGPNEERGVYKTTDGGRTWERVLYVDENTGVIDLVGDPGDPETLYAAMYQRRRTAFGFNGGGPGSGIYRTTDGGATWTELTNGLPDGDMGRIGLEVYRRDGNLVYAVVEARGDAQGVYRSTDRGETWEQMSQENPRPMYFSKIRIDPNDPERIYLGGVQLHISSDGGRTFVRNAREVHSDHHALWIDPSNSNHLIMGSDGGISVSFDRAESWRMYDNIALAQFYEIGFDMQDPYFVCGGLQDNGTWCGPSATWSQQGVRNHDWFNIHGGDGFYAQMDPSDPSIVFAESQNGNISRVDLTTGERQSIRPLMRGDMDNEDEEDDDYRWNWNTPIHISIHNRQTLYAGANVLARSTDQGRSWTIISPDLTKDLDRSTLEIMGVPENRMLSRHDGVSSYGTITTIAESPLDANVLYVGTDDGNVQVTRDGGTTWTNVFDAIPELPERTYVSRVVASNHEAGAVYATFDGHYADDYRPYVYVSTNYGNSWRRITTGLPDWSVNVLAEHPRSADLLFVGNEVGVFFSIDRGEAWHRLDSNLPTVPVDDIKIHPRENDLILGTHGRSIWVLDDIAPLEQLSADVLAADVHAFPVGQATLVNRNSPQGWTPGAFETPDGPTEALIRYYLGREVAPAAPVTADEPAEQGPMASNGQDEMNGDTAVSISILDATGATVRTLDGPGEAGTHQVEWDLRMNPPYEVEENQQGGGGFFGRPRGPLVMPGTYTARIDAHGTSRTVEIPVRADPRIQISAADRQARQDAMMTLNALGKPLHDAGEALDRVVAQVESAKKLLKDAENAPDALKAEADSLSQALDDVDDDVNGASRTALRLFFTIERATMRPSADQLWQVDEVWEDATEAIEELNALITGRIPAFHQRLNAEGIRPDTGQAVALPSRR